MLKHLLTNHSKKCALDTKQCDFFFKFRVTGALHSTFHGATNKRSTIYALSSGYGKCGVAVVRISGPKASQVIFNIGGMKTLPPPRLAKLCKLRDPVTKDILDRGLMLWFPGPKSFSGEDICELHIHGGQAVISSILVALSKLPDFQPAEPGEFTRRAFYSGKLDLTEVEGLSDLLSAETEAQRKQAYLQMEGALSNLYNSWRQIVLKCVAHLEAFIDFSEDENIEDNIMVQVNSILYDLQKQIQDHVCHSKCGERLRDGVRTVIVGEPNVGKSSLLNTLCKRPAAIVTPKAGTTRDIIELHMNISGYPVILADTAGLHSGTHDIVEIEGMARAKAFASSADLLLFVVNAVDYEHNIKSGKVSNFENYITDYISSFGIESFKNISVDQILLKKDCVSQNKGIVKESNNNSNLKCYLILLNKCDLVGNPIFIQNSVLSFHNVLCISCKTGKGINDIQSRMTENLIHLCGSPSQERPSFTQARHRYHLTQSLNCINDYFNIYESNGDLVLAAQKLRNTLRHIGKITGHISTEQILDVIFNDFCIGK